MPDVEAIVQKLLPTLPLLVSMAVHFILVSFYQLSSAALESNNQIVLWMPALIFTHTILFLVGLWAMLDKESVEAVISYIVVIAFTILLDIIQLGLYFPSLQSSYGRGDSQTARTWQFTAACVIVNLLFKPLSLVLASIVLFVRAGGSLGSFTRPRDSYATVHGSNEGGSASAAEPQ